MKTTKTSKSDMERLGFRLATKIYLKNIKKISNNRVKNDWNQYIYITKSKNLWKIIEKLADKNDNILDVPDYMRLRILPYIRHLTQVSAFKYIIIVNNINSIDAYEKRYFVSCLIDSKNKQVVEFKSKLFSDKISTRRTKLVI